MNQRTEKLNELKRVIKRTSTFCKAMANSADDFITVDSPAEAIIHLCKIRDVLNEELPPEDYPIEVIQQNPYKWLETKIDI